MVGLATLSNSVTGPPAEHFEDGAVSFFLDHLKSTLRQRSLEKLANEVTLVASALEANAGARGLHILFRATLI